MTDDADVIYGRHPVREALEAGEPLGEVLVAEGARTAGGLGAVVESARARGVPVKWVPRAALDRLVAGRRGGKPNHQGVAARVAAYGYADLATILAHAIRRGEPPFVLVLDAVQDVHNLGHLLRTAEAVGVHGVLLADREGAGVTGAVRKASAGAVAHLAIARVDLAQALDALRARGVRVVGLDAAGAVDYTAVDLRGPVALVVGGEGRGIRPVVRRRCDDLARLPMRGHVASLNAGVAGSVLLYEALRQREGDDPAARI